MISKAVIHKRRKQGSHNDNVPRIFRRLTLCTDQTYRWTKPPFPLPFHETEIGANPQAQYSSVETMNLSNVALGRCLASSPFWKFPHELPRMAILKDTWSKVEGTWKDFNYAHVNLVGLETWSANPPFWLRRIPPVLGASMSALCLIQ